jgi:hypothetical protein
MFAVSIAVILCSYILRFYKMKLPSQVSFILRFRMPNRISAITITTIAGTIIFHIR